MGTNDKAYAQHTCMRNPHPDLSSFSYSLSSLSSCFSNVPGRLFACDSEIRARKRFLKPPISQEAILEGVEERSVWKMGSFWANRSSCILRVLSAT